MAPPAGEWHAQVPTQGARQFHLGLIPKPFKSKERIKNIHALNCIVYHALF